MNGIKSWFYGLESREKNMVMLLGVALMILILTVALVLPLKNYYAELSSDAEYFESKVSRVANNVARLKSTNPQAVNTSSQPLNQLITSTANPFGLKFSNVDMNSKKTEVQVRLDNADFNQLILWVAQLEQNRGLVVESMRVSENDDIGRVSASLKLSR